MVAVSFLEKEHTTSQPDSPLQRSWYTSPKSMVRVNGVLSSPFTLERGVLQGSVLSPVLFLLIMDPLLKSLQSNGVTVWARQLVTHMQEASSMPMINALL